MTANPRPAPTPCLPALSIDPVQLAQIGHSLRQVYDPRLASELSGLDELLKNLEDRER